MLKRMLCIAVLLFCTTVFAQKIPVRDLARHSAEITNLTAPNSMPFYLKATVVYGTASSPQGEIEEYWISPTKWRRTIKFPAFSQTTIVNGATHYEKNEGIYFPTGLRVLSEALFQPIPDTLQQALSQSNVKLNFYSGLSVQKLAEKVHYCDSNESKTGALPAENAVLISVCFSGDPANSTISSITKPGYNVEFKDRKPFGKLLIARDLISELSAKKKWEAQITELSPLTTPDESLFAAQENTPESRRFQLFQVNEQDARQHFKNLPALVLPTHTGKTSGVVTIYISTDKEGFVSEAWPLSSENTEAAAAACEQILQWRLGEPNPERFVQLETLFTFSF